MFLFDLLYASPQLDKFHKRHVMSNVHILTVLSVACPGLNSGSILEKLKHVSVESYQEYLSLCLMTRCGFHLYSMYCIVCIVCNRFKLIARDILL